MVKRSIPISDNLRGAHFEIIDPEILENEKYNTNSYSKTLGESHIVYSQVLIDGIDFSKENNLEVIINQKYLDHNQFEIIVPSEAFDERDELPLTNSRKYLGSRVTIQMIQFDKTTFIFTGIITKITNKRRQGYSFVSLSGKSPTILLDSGLNCRSFQDSTLEEIIKTLVKDLPSDVISFDIRPHSKQVLPYTVQYNETNFEFIKRLAIRYGEWLYYDGQRLVFGGYGGKTIEMVEQQDIYEYDLRIETLPQNFSYVAYDPRRGQNHLVESTIIDLQDPVNPFQFSALKSSEKIFKNQILASYNQSLMFNGEVELREAVKKQKLSRQDLVRLSAKSWNPESKLGDILMFKGWIPNHPIFTEGEVPLESYRIIEINHYHGGVEGYKNEILAVPRDLYVPPYIDQYFYPRAEEQSAVVVDNNDPEKMNRVKVQFPWQNYNYQNEMTPWIWIVQNYAGKGKGNHFIPEIGEEVMVGFESGNMEKPYVIGCRYNGKEKSEYHTPNNDKKAIHTRSGTKIVLNDSEGSIFIEDPSGSTYLMDGNGNINVNAPETIFFNAKNIVISSSQNISINAGDTISSFAGEDYCLSANNIFESAGNNKHSKAKQLVENSESGIYNSEGGKLELESKEEIISNSLKRTNLH